MKIYIILQALLAVLAVHALTGCAGSTGWRFEIGVSPVKQLDNRAGLTQEKEDVRKY
jgi:hypothetical protein